MDGVHRSWSFFDDNLSAAKYPYCVLSNCAFQFALQPIRPLIYLIVKARSAIIVPVIYWSTYERQFIALRFAI
jgi:hypothetical protein